MPGTLMAIRSINKEELAVLTRAIAVGPSKGGSFPSADELRSLQVVAKCRCGCASVDFAHLAPGRIASVLANALGVTPGGDQVGVLVFAYEGQITGLEIVGYSDDPGMLPVPSSIRGWGDARA